MKKENKNTLNAELNKAMKALEILKEKVYTLEDALRGLSSNLTNKKLSPKTIKSGNLEVTTLTEEEIGNLRTFKDKEELLEYLRTAENCDNIKVRCSNYSHLFNDPFFQEKDASFFKGVERWSFRFAEDVSYMFYGCKNFKVKLDTKIFRKKVNYTDMLTGTAISEAALRRFEKKMVKVGGVSGLFID